MQPISRRDFIVLGATAAAAAPFAAAPFADGLSRPPSAIETGNPFALGVTSGDPDQHSAVLWTRLVGAGLADEVPVTWEVAGDESFGTITASGDVIALANEGHSVHVIADLTGASWFRFRSGDWASAAGRVWPTPGDPSALRIAAASCQHFESGYYAAHRDIVEWSPDLVMFLGDFIYEGGGNPAGDTVRVHEGGEIMVIEDYRARYAQYLSDEHLRASRAVAPWLVIWDDHEVENNYAGVAPQTIADMATFAERKLAAHQAWWEHMPVRMARPESLDDMTIYRNLAWGGLADLILLDGRQYRTNQACNDVTLSLDPPCETASDPARTMLGAEQEDWLAEQLASSTATWPVIAQQTVLTDARLNGAVLNYDQWDGYGPARDRLLAAAAMAERVVVLTGDIHLAGVGILPGVGVEFVTASISSGGLVPEDLEDIVATLGDIQAAELHHRGYTRHVITAETWTAEYRIVDDVTDPVAALTTLQTFVIEPAARDIVTAV